MKTLKDAIEKAELISTIDWTENYFLSNDFYSKLPEWMKEQIELFKQITEQLVPLKDLENRLKEIYGEWQIIKTKEWIRFANCIWWKNTQLHRSADKIILPWSKIEESKECQHNIWNQIIDPIAWASRTAAPNDYWLLWKIPKFRGLEWNKEFDKKLYDELFNTQVEVSQILWYAIEINKDEQAIMPIVSLKWWEDIIMQFSEEKNEDDIPTAKYYWINL